MRVEYINPFITATTNVFETMVNCKLTRGEIRVLSDESPCHPISGIIGLSGKAVGTVVLSLSKELALKAASALLMTEVTEINDDVVDAVGELANMVAGGAKAKLDEYELSISLPSVITGAGHEVRFPSKVTPICVPFESEWGSLTIEVGLEEVAQPVGA
ncbi:MAG: chemotaxis protein CheX [Planctomycetes bacterium]|nr:chemotaxis protein CheX [Planctomycetota bacterium]